MKLREKNILVTGGAGFIGSHLVDRLIREEPAGLVVVDNFFLGHEENLAEARKFFPELKVYRLDASDLAAMHQVVKAEQIDVVFNLAVVPLPTSLQYPVWTIETNVGIATTLLAEKDVGPQVIVVLSGVEKRLLVTPPQRAADHCRFDELGPRPNDRDDLHVAPVRLPGLHGCMPDGKRCQLV